MKLYTHTMEYYSVIKRNKLLIHTAKWTNLKITTLRKMSQTQKTKS